MQITPQNFMLDPQMSRKCVNLINVGALIVVKQRTVRNVKNRSIESRRMN